MMYIVKLKKGAKAERKEIEAASMVDAFMKARKTYPDWVITGGEKKSPEGESDLQEQ